MYPRDLETWTYTDEDGCPRYISPSNVILIMLDPFKTEEEAESQWFWRVYDDGIPDLDGIDLFDDGTWDHEFAYFADAGAAYYDVLEKGMERSR